MTQRAKEYGGRVSSPPARPSASRVTIAAQRTRLCLYFEGVASMRVDTIAHVMGLPLRKALALADIFVIDGTLREVTRFDDRGRVRAIVYEWRNHAEQK